MDRKKLSGITVVFFIYTFVFVGKLYAEDLKKPLLQLPRVDVIEDKDYDQTFMESIFESERFIAASENDQHPKTEDSSGFFNAAYGRFNSKLFDLMQSARTDRFYYSAKVSVNDSNGERTNSKFTTYRPTFKLGMPFDQENEFIFNLNYFNKIIDLPGMVNNPTPSAKRRNTDLDISTVIQHEEDGFQWAFEPYYEFSVMNDDLFRPDFKNKVFGSKLNVDIEGNIFNINAYQDRLINYYEQMIIDAKFRHRRIDLNDQWQLTLGANLFAQENFGQRPAPFIEFIFSENEDSLHKFTLTRNFKPMVFSQVYLNDNYTEVNPLPLRPRRQSSAAYQFDRHISTEWRATVLVYLREVKDLWFWNDGDGDGLYSPAVIKKANFAGIKLSTEYNWTESFSNFFNLTLRKIRSKDSAFEFIPYEPKQRISLGINYIFAEKFKINLVGDYFGRRFYSGNSKQSSSGYFLLSSKLTFEAKDYLTFFVLIDNLLNDHYEIVKGYPNQSRSILSGVMVKF